LPGHRPDPALRDQNRVLTLQKLWPYVRSPGALVTMSERRKNPPQAPEQIIDLLVERYGMDGSADILRPLLVESR
ncbi:MAG: hypothetical protein L0H25_00590, partial [Micrococcales bacterium]|nr:hypothetical protein [Micrococcales bacterium]